MRLIDHPTHKWRYSDSSYYDFICENCGVPEGTRKAGEPCEHWVKNLKPGDWGSWYSLNRGSADDLGATISEETQQNLKAIDDNIRNAMMNAHKFYVD